MYSKTKSKSDANKKKDVKVNLDISKMPYDEYLKKTMVTTYLKDVYTLLLENRPKRSLDFIAD